MEGRGSRVIKKTVRCPSSSLVPSAPAEMPHVDMVIASFLPPNSLPDFPQACLPTSSSIYFLLKERISSPCLGLFLCLGNFPGICQMSYFLFSPASAIPAEEKVRLWSMLVGIW